MPSEMTRKLNKPKPWGSSDLRPWDAHHGKGPAIGEIWFQRRDAAAPDGELLLKLLFTSAPLSIQVHPDDAFARGRGQAGGKSEAWYVLAAAPGAKIALGPWRSLTASQLRGAIDDGSIAAEVQWRDVHRGEAIYVPAGTIHAVGAGLVLVEIQQRSDATFRLFDFGRHRALHPDDAVAVANRDPAPPSQSARGINAQRTLLVSSPHFVLERISLPPDSEWSLRPPAETWLLVIQGRLRADAVEAGLCEALYCESGGTALRAGPDGCTGIVAYACARPAPALLRQSADARRQPYAGTRAAAIPRHAGPPR